MKKRLRRFIKVTLAYFLFYSGVLTLVRWAHRNKEGLGILMYHRVTEKGEEGVSLPIFEKQIAWVSRHYPMRPLSEMLLCRKEGRPCPRRVFTVTVDDGYPDFLSMAYPVLKKRNVPTTLFAVSDCLDGKPLWTRSLKRWFEKTSLKSFEIPLDGQTLSFSLKSESEKLEARETLKEALKRVKDAQRRASLQEIRKKLVGETGEDKETEAMLTWEEVIRLSQDGVEVGAHTLDHPILSQMPLQEARHQIFESKRRLEERLGKPVRLFCYPNGLSQDFNEAIEEILRESGFLGSCTIIEGENSEAYNPYALKRIVTWEKSLPVFACYLEGCFDLFAKPASPVVPVLVMGQSRTGVSTDQLLGQRGIPVIKVAQNQKSLGAYSKYGTFEALEVGDTEGLLSLVKKLKARYHTSPVLIPTSDEMVEWLSEARDVLKGQGRILLPQPGVVETFLDKARFAKKAQELGVPIPKTVSVGPQQTSADTFQEMHLPYVVKPSDGHARRFEEEKALWITTEDELQTVSARLRREKIPFLVQEAIPGDDACHWSCAVYLDAAGERLACFTARKIRQYPPLVGMGSLCESRWNERVASEATALLQKLNYVGVAEVEFKEDPRDGTLKVIEVNPRLWAQHPLAARCGIDFAFMLYQGSLGIRPQKALPQREGIRWLALDLDLLTVRQMFREGRMDVATWLGSYRFPIEPDLYHMSDLGPAIYQTAKLTKSFLFKARGRMS